MEKKIECEIVQDLLLGYVDDTLNNESKKLVEKHLGECEDCRIKFEMMKNDMDNNTEIQDKEIDYLKKIRKNISKKNKVAVALGIILILVVVFNAIVFANYFLTANTICIYLNDDITEEEVENIIEKIKNEDEGAEIVYYSKDDELAKMQEALGENADLLDEYSEAEKNIFPASIEVTTKFSKTDDIEYLCLSIDGVKSVKNKKDSNPYVLFWEK